MRIIGTVGDIRPDLETDPEPTIYTFYLQQDRPDAGEIYMTLLVRAAGDPMRLAGAVRGRLAAVDRTQAPTRIETLEQSRAESIAPRRANMVVLVSFALLALLLGSAGVYGVMSHAVSRRTHEIGVRVALGADWADITTMIVGRGLLLVGVGEAAGLATALTLNRVIASMLFHVATTDALTYAAVAGLWLIVGLAACYIPARRAMRVDPTAALRCE
jgi:putative ABC transport system permease protein